ncbi:DUF2817 domain-containing protein [Marinobacteraceae bacterium S3BR75-40.1]
MDSQQPSPSAADVVTQERNRRSKTQRRRLQTYLPEMATFERLMRDAPATVRCEVLERVAVRNLELPLYAVSLGSQDPKAPVLFLVGGVHGLERIGAQVVLAYLQSVVSRLQWDEGFARILESVRLVSIPLLNPGGMYLNQRANPQGVDLMRNAPIKAQDETAFLLGGQRFSRHLPWYTGHPESGLEAESQALKRLIARAIGQCKFALSLDCHSGFGFKDQLWFPYAYRRRPMRRIASVMALKLLWERTYPNHNYLFEPQSANYLTHGDLWDFFYKQYNRTPITFIPLTLEMGSWRWVRKRPRQLFTLQGLFNPLVPHRHERVLRRHLVLLDFLLQATMNYRNWVPDPERARELRQMALTLWYDGVRS